jgi:hypothetical protein
MSLRDEVAESDDEEATVDLAFEVGCGLHDPAAQPAVVMSEEFEALMELACPKPVFAMSDGYTDRMIESADPSVLCELMEEVMGAPLAFHAYCTR